MILDLRTIFVVSATTALILGCLQLAAYLATGRKERWPLWWGVSNVLVGLGIFGGAYRGLVADWVSIEFANVLLLGGFLLLHATLREFAGKPAPVRLHLIVLATAGLLLFVWREPDNFPLRVMLVSSIAAACDLAMLREIFLQARRERLASAWVMLGFVAPTFLFSFIRVVLAMTDGLGGELFPPNGSKDQWIQLFAVSILILRSAALLLMAAERDRKLLLALARQDALTGVMNRAGFTDALARLGAGRKHGTGKRRVSRLSVLLIDIDDFKSLNDGHGHEAGDNVLRLFADSARRQLRETDLIARQGGDEFTVVLPGVNAAEAGRVAERIRQSFATDVAILRLAPPPTLSIGVSEGDVAQETIDALLRQADKALYRSKLLGRNRVEVEPRPA